MAWLWAVEAIVQSAMAKSGSKSGGAAAGSLPTDAPGDGQSANPSYAAAAAAALPVNLIFCIGIRFPLSWTCTFSTLFWPPLPLSARLSKLTSSLLLLPQSAWKRESHGELTEVAAVAAGDHTRGTMNLRQ